MAELRPTRLLVFNFFAGLKPRGIPMYARELEACFARLGIEHEELVAPAWLRDAPSWLQNLMYVWYEQVVAPWVARRRGCALTVYPYNAGAVVDAWAGRSLMVVHDLIPNRKEQRGLAARYIRSCQVWHARCRGPVATVSRHTQRQLQRIRQFDACPKYLWMNPFYAFEAHLAEEAVAPRVRAQTNAPPLRVLLCSGIGGNKDFQGALALFRRLPPGQIGELRVLGFGGDAELARTRVRERLPEPLAARVTVLPRLSLGGIVAELRAADLVWVHSRAEGFGRPVVEARMCARPVLATDIGAFRQLRKLQHVHLYQDDSFATALAGAVADTRVACPAIKPDFLHEQLEHEVLRLLREQLPVSSAGG